VAGAVLAGVTANRHIRHWFDMAPDIITIFHYNAEDGPSGRLRCAMKGMTRLPSCASEDIGMHRKHRDHGETPELAARQHSAIPSLARRSG